MAITHGTEPPIVVDLDGTLLNTDTLWECLVSCVRRTPLQLLEFIPALVNGKASFKRRVAEAADLQVEALPYREDFLGWLQEQKAHGRSLLLATGADRSIAERIAAHLGIFDGIIASDGAENATGEAKALLIGALLKGAPFAYAGNAMVDVPIWKRAASSIVVSPDRGVLSALRRNHVEIAATFDGQRHWSLAVWLRAIRVHQWVKNVLVFLPAFLSHRVFDSHVVLNSVLGFFAFSGVASSIYLLNDLLDLQADRQHPTKKHRPMAAGIISIPGAMGMAALLLGGSAAICLLLPPLAFPFLLGYSLFAMVYSSYFKRILVADVTSLALFYTGRILFGGLITGVGVSVWALAFSAFTFFALAAAKRINDLTKVAKTVTSLVGRAYYADDRSPLVAQAAATANIAVLVLILYLNSPQVTTLYHRPQMLWGMCPVLMYWFNRLITMANRGILPDDPILFAAKDKASYVVMAVLVLIAILAI
jgi:4-hydroxybenzoate polyprenyltransferase